jgi:hypothetical protein
VLQADTWKQAIYNLVYPCLLTGKPTSFAL